MSENSFVPPMSVSAESRPGDWKPIQATRYYVPERKLATEGTAELAKEATLNVQRFEISKFHRNVPSDELLADVRRVAADLGQAKLTIDEYNECGSFNATTLTRRFSSWFKVLEKAGLESTRNLNIPNNTLFENLVDVWTALGRQPRYADITRDVSRFSVGTYEKRFHGWINALEAFADWANSEVQPTTEVAPTDHVLTRPIHGADVRFAI